MTPAPGNGDEHAVRPAPVGRAAFMLGFAGLLPPLGCVAWMLLGEGDAALVALAYALLILSFLGGIWWGLAMQRSAGQGTIAALAVVPSLVALPILFVALLNPGLALVLAGSAILLTLPVDRWLVARGIAPANWMRLRVPLSLGLGALTILAGVIVAGRP